MPEVYLHIDARMADYIRTHLSLFVPRIQDRLLACPRLSRFVRGSHPPGCAVGTDKPESIGTHEPEPHLRQESALRGGEAGIEDIPSSADQGPRRGWRVGCKVDYERKTGT